MPEAGRDAGYRRWKLEALLVILPAWRRRGVRVRWRSKELTMGIGDQPGGPERRGGLWDLRPGPGAAGFPWTRPEVRELHRLLADLYFRGEGVIALVQAAGMPSGAIPWSGTMEESWLWVLEEAYNRGQGAPPPPAMTAKDGGYGGRVGAHPGQPFPVKDRSKAAPSKRVVKLCRCARGKLLVAGNSHVRKWKVRVTMGISCWAMAASISGSHGDSSGALRAHSRTSRSAKQHGQSPPEYLSPAPMTSEIQRNRVQRGQRSE